MIATWPSVRKRMGLVDCEAMVPGGNWRLGWGGLDGG